VKKLLFGTVFLLVVSVLPVTAIAQVQVGINIGVPPPFAFSAPPELVVVPSGPDYVYMVPGTVGLYFHGGYWYRHHGGHWFRAVSYSDPWAPIEIGLVPAPIVVVPPDYILNMPQGYRRIITTTSIVIGGVGNAIATGITMVGTGTIPGVIGQGKSFIDHHQVILAIEDLMESQWLEGLEDRMVNRVDQGMEDLRESQVDLDRMVNQAAQELVARRVSQVVPVEADLTLKCMDHRAK